MIKTTSDNRLFELDALRGIAAIAVVLFHYTFGIDNGTKNFDPDKFYFSYGYLGVHLFFLISGFVIFMTLDKTKKPLDFIISRFSRLYPAYWAAIFTTIIVTFILRTNVYSLNQVLVNITMFQYWFKVKDIDGAYWTLAVELTFYTIMWLLFVFNQLKNISMIAIVWLVLSAIYALFEIPLEKFINVIFILKYAPLFIGGIAFYSIKTDKSKLINHILVFLSFISICIVSYSNKADVVIYSLITSFFIVFYLFVYNKLKFLNNRVLIFLGSISYSVYLIHENIGVAIIFYLKRMVNCQLFYLPITIAIIIIFAAIINKKIEKPAMNFIRNKYKNYAK
jgi:peptidoglycan/LPS O-acetylase OafA/YrhL